ncbi:MAG: AI-2E family transporter [bacterium]|nr:AI-2E family transporter [bacterium]
MSHTTNDNDRDRRDKRLKRNVGLGIVGALCAWFAWNVRTVLNPLLLAYLLAYMVHPIVLKLEKRKWTRMRAVNTIYLLCMALGLVVSILFWSQGANLLQRVVANARNQDSGLFTTLDQRFGELVKDHRDSGWVAWLLDEESESDTGTDPVEGGDPGPDSDPDPTKGAGNEAQEEAVGGEPLGGHEVAAVNTDDTLHLLPALQRVWNEVVLGADSSVAESAAKRGVRVATNLFGSMMGLISMLVLLPIYTWFLLFDLEKIHGFVREYIPKRERKRFAEVGGKIGEVLSSFFRGQLVVCFLKGLSISIGLYIAGVPYALFLGLTAGFAALIPFFGASMAAVFTFLVGLLGSGDQAVELVPHLIRIVAVFGIAELLEGYVFVPRIIGESLGLNPLVVLVSVFAGGAALGMFGFLIALPLTATLVILAKEFVLPALRDWANEAAPGKG